MVAYLKATFYLLVMLCWAQPQKPSQQFLDVEGYRRLLVQQVDVWNGGLDGQSGMGAYRTEFEGFLNVNLEQDWSQRSTRSVSAVAQSRGIYMNVEAYRASREERFLDVALKATDYLLDHFWDQRHGGFYWEVGADNRPNSRSKQGYGNVHALFALAHVYDITRDETYLQAALQQLEVLKTHFKDPNLPGAVFPGFRYDFSVVEGVNNIDTFTHYFEALLALFDVTEGQTQTEITALIEEAGEVLVHQLYRNQDGFTDRGYVAYNYDQQWNPSQQPYSRQTQWSGALQATTGHGIELAYLLSRAVERGFNPVWLETADKLLRFVDAYAIHPETGGLLYEITDYSGKPLEGNPDNEFYIWWAQAEVARTNLHFAVVRKQDRLPGFKKAQAFILDYFLDEDYGGWFQTLNQADLTVPDKSKGNIWTMNYHEAMLYAEILRLAEAYPESLEALNHE